MERLIKKTSEAKINIYLNGQNLHVEWQLDSDKAEYDWVIPKETDFHRMYPMRSSYFDFVFHLFYYSIKSIFNMMPLDEIYISSNSRIIKPIARFIHCNNEIVKTLPLLSPGKNILISSGHEVFRHESFAEFVQSIYPHRKVFYVNAHAYNSDLLTLRMLFSALKENKIGNVIMSPHLISKFVRKDNLDILYILDRLGINVFRLDNDPFEKHIYSHLERATWNTVESRFSPLPILNRYWDDYFGINNAVYGPLLQDYGMID